MGISCPVTGQENSWRARRWVFCISSSRQGLGNRALPSSIDSKMHIFGSLKSGLNSQTVASYPYCRSEVKAGVPEDDHTDSARHWGHPASNCLTLGSLLEVLLFLFSCCCLFTCFEVLLDPTDCANTESKPARVPWTWDSYSQWRIFPSLYPVSRLRHTHIPLPPLPAWWFYFPFTLSVRVSQLCMWNLLLDFPSWAFFSLFWRHKIMMHLHLMKICFLTVDEKSFSYKCYI